MMKIFSPLLLIIFALFSGCEKDLSTSPEEQLLSKNALIIDSAPMGAKIYLDGKNTGQYTPDTLFWLKEGNLKVTLKLEFFKDTSLTVQMSAADTQKLFFDYTKNASMLGVISFDSNPRDAEIFINDSSLNQRTPYEIRKVLPGTYKVTYKKSGYWDQSKNFNVRTSYTTYVNQSLNDSLIWVNFNTERTGIPSDFLTALDIGKDYVKWIGTVDAGLIKFDDKTWTVYNTSNSILPDNKINYIYVDDDNVTWVCTNNGLLKIDGNIWTVFNTLNSGLPDDRVTSISKKDNRLWAGTTAGGVAIYDGNNWTVMNMGNSPLPSNQINYILNHTFNIWVCTGNGLLKISEFLNDTLYTVLTAENDSMPNNNVKTIVIDNSGNPWIGFGTEGKSPGGTSVKLGRFWTTYVNKPSEYVYSIAVDKNDIKWFGSSENGLSKLLSIVWSSYTTSNSAIGSNRIFKVVIDNNGYKWMASYGGGLIKYKGN